MSGGGGRGSRCCRGMASNQRNYLEPFPLGGVAILLWNFIGWGLSLAFVSVCIPLLCVCVDCVRVRWATLFFCCLWCSWNVNNRMPRMPARRASSLDSICFFFFLLLLLPLLPFSFLGMFCLFDFWRESEKKRMISSTKARGLDFRSLGNGTTPHRPSTHHRAWAAELLRWSAYNLRWSGDVILTHFFGFRFVSFFSFRSWQKAAVGDVVGGRPCLRAGWRWGEFRDLASRSCVRPARKANHLSVCLVLFRVLLPYLRKKTEKKEKKS